MNLGKNLRIVFILATGGLFTLVMMFLAIRPIRAAGPWYVAPGGDDGNDCLSPGAPCATINGATARADSGDTIYVATGTYTGTGDEVILVDRDVTLSGGWDASFTVQSGTSTIDGEETHRGITVDTGVTAVVDRLTVQHGYTGSDGGGVRNSGTLTMTNCAISDNFADYAGYFGHGGGGIYNVGALTLISSTVSNNTSIDGGGGILATGGSSTVILDSQIISNTASSWEGGGMQVHDNSALSLYRSWVMANVALSNDGGGIGCNNASSALIENSIIAGNSTAGTGGGLFFTESGLYQIVNSHIVGNEAGYRGAAIVGYYAQVEVTNTLIISNTGYTGIDDQGSSGSEFVLSYCDTYGNSPDGTDGVTITRTNCLGTPPEDGLDPLMAGGALPSGVGPAFAEEWMSFDFRLLPGSPAIDAGTPVGAPATDIVGNPRDASPDLGAYEHNCVPPPEGLVSWWPGEGHAIDIADGNDGMLQGGTGFAIGKVGQAFSFDGLDDQVNVGNAPNLHLSEDEFTILAWVRFNTDDLWPVGDDMSITDKMSSNGVNRDGWRLFRQRDFGNFMFCLGGGSVNGCDHWAPTPPTTVLATTVAQKDVWYLVAGVLGSSEFSIYVNGVAEDSKARPEFTDTNSTDLLIGANAPEGAYLDGLVDEVTLFNRALSAVEILDIFNAGSKGMCRPRVFVFLPLIMRNSD